ncbi:uncharacterized protein [Antedon mediterranea]|uniref:uncharacterized protein n=1 Tax=Antedon mediterranea TaxID=105859 RepID=UPI003AF60BEC
MAEVLCNSTMIPSPDTTVAEEPDIIIIEDIEPILDVESLDSPTVTPKINKRTRPRPDYMRHVKSPFSYVEMISYVIELHSETMLTLQEIVSCLPKVFPCLRGGYVGWKNSVRHTLSVNECFKKVLRRPDRPFGKDNFWVMNEDCNHCKLSRTARDLEVRYEQYMQKIGETNQLKIKRSPITSSQYQVIYPKPMPLPNYMPVMDQAHTNSYAMDLSNLVNNRKRKSLDNEPLDLSLGLKKYKSSPPPSSFSPTPDYSRDSPVSSPDGSCSPVLRSYNPHFMPANFKMHTRKQPEYFLFRSKVHMSPHITDRTMFLKSMAELTYEFDATNGRFKKVQSNADPRRPIYMLSKIPRPLYTTER